MTYTRVNDFTPHWDSLLGGDLYVGATYTQVYMVICHSYFSIHDL